MPEEGDAQQAAQHQEKRQGGVGKDKENGQGRMNQLPPGQSRGAERDDGNITHQVSE